VSILEKVARYGLVGSTGVAYKRAKRSLMAPYYRRKHKLAPVYHNPSDEELKQIEEELRSHNNSVKELTISPHEFEDFQRQIPIPPYYFASNDAALRTEKILEHFIAYKMCKLQDALPIDGAPEAKDFLYLDVGGCGSPWVQVLSEHGINAVSIDLAISPMHRHLKSYRKMDATRTVFDPASVDSMSLQCAYEMFAGDSDCLLIDECARILKPGGKLVIVPLYMHTHYCGYSTPDYYGKGFADAGATEYIRPDCWGIPFSRKYDVAKLNERVLSRAERQGMRCVLHVLRNKEQIGSRVYCHFVLEITNARRD